VAQEEVNSENSTSEVEKKARMAYTIAQQAGSNHGASLWIRVLKGKLGLISYPNGVRFCLEHT
jgi:hypothetical protein